MKAIKFGERVKELRLENNISQRKLARLLNIAQPAISDWENKGACSDYQTLVLLSELFNVSTDYLLGLTD